MRVGWLTVVTLACLCHLPGWALPYLEDGGGNNLDEGQGGAFAKSSQKGDDYSMYPSGGGTQGDEYSMSPLVGGPQGDEYSMSPLVGGTQGDEYSRSPLIGSTQGDEYSMSSLAGDVVAQGDEGNEYSLDKHQPDTMLLEDKLKDIHRRLYSSQGDDSSRRGAAGSSGNYLAPVVTPGGNGVTGDVEHTPHSSESDSSVRELASLMEDVWTTSQLMREEADINSNNNLPLATANNNNQQDGIQKKSAVHFEAPQVEITAVVSYSPREAVDDDEETAAADVAVDDNSNSRGQNSGGDDYWANNSNQLGEKVKEDVSIALTWWQLILLILASLLIAIICCYFSGCCFVIVDCCSDSYWGCCPCCRCCARMLKPRGKRTKMKKREVHQSTTYSLNESSTAPRRSVERSNFSLEEPLLSSSTRSTHAPPRAQNVSRNASIHRAASNRSVATVTPAAGGQTNGSLRNIDVTTALQENNSTLGSNSVRSVRNYRRSSSAGGSRKLSGGRLEASNNSYMTSPNSYMTSLNRRGVEADGGGHTSPAPDLGVDDCTEVRSADHQLELSLVENDEDVRRSPIGPDYSSTPIPANGSKSSSNQPPINDSSSSYFSWLNVFGGKRRRRYKVSTRKKPAKSSDPIYRQSKYRHIATSRNSAVIPVKISKRASTASTFSVRPLHVRSRSAETVASQAGGGGAGGDLAGQHLLGSTSSERNLPTTSSRLSANLAEIEARRISGRSGGTPVVCPLPPREDYNLKYFEKSLLQSKETTL